MCLCASSEAILLHIYYTTFDVRSDVLFRWISFVVDLSLSSSSLSITLDLIELKLVCQMSHMSLHIGPKLLIVHKLGNVSCPDSIDPDSFLCRIVDLLQQD